MPVIRSSRRFSLAPPWSSWVVIVAVVLLLVALVFYYWAISKYPA